MKLIVIVLSMLVEKYGEGLYSIRHFGWLSAWYAWIQGKLKNHDALMLLVSLLPIILCVALFAFWFSGLFWGAGRFVLEFALFFFCLGPKNFFRMDDAKTLAPALYFSEVNQGWFAFIFWYLLFGIVGAVTYRLFERLALENHVSKRLLSYLDWLPARLTAFFYLLVGNLQPSLPYFISHIRSGVDNNNTLLSECGLNAATHTKEKEVTLSDAMRIVSHAMILFLVCIAFLTIVAWL